jgi:hypothetical protein
MAKTDNKKTALLSVAQIAKQTGHSSVAVHKAIERFEIQPEQTTPSGYRYFPVDTVVFLKENMRSPGVQS